VSDLLLILIGVVVGFVIGGLSVAGIYEWALDGVAFDD
jgi:hypothetical protein